MVEEHKKELNKQLWNIANTLRGNMSADEFRDYILGFIFYKYLSEKLNRFANEILAGDGIKFETIDENSDDGKKYLEALQKETIDQLGFFLKPSELFHILAAKGEKGNFIIDSLTEILNHIEQSTMGSAAEDDFNGLFDDIDLTSNKLGKTEKAKNELIAKVLSHLNAIDFCLDDTEIDILGDAYEYLIGQFASGAGKKAGEFYTPQMVSKLLAKIVTDGKQKLRNIYDPTCGSGSLLLRIAKEVSEIGEFCGQEANPSTYNLARMNMILHDIHYSRFDIQQDDSLEQPLHLDKRFEAVVANPPFSIEWGANDLFRTDERFSNYGVLPPKRKADYAFILHMIHQLDDDGVMAVVVPHGVLTRGLSEHKIRKRIIEDLNYLDCVISLPENIFFGTGIPTCILVIKKTRSKDEDILIIDASKEFEKGSNKNQLREKDINKIHEVYSNRKIVEYYSAKTTAEKIKANNFLLNIPRYVAGEKEDLAADMPTICSALQENQKQIEIVDSELQLFCKELGIKPPEGVCIPLIEQYKESLSNYIFSQEVRFQDKSGNSFPEWGTKELSTILDYLQPTKFLVESTNYDDSYSTPVLTAGKTFILGYTNEIDGIFQERLPTIIFDDFTTAFKYVDFPFKAKSSAMKMLVPKEDDTNMRFIFEAMKTIDFPRGEHKRYWISEYQHEEIPYPCPEEQELIVQVLSRIDQKIALISQTQG
ncbi:MAG: type I restriction-modification system subunit M [Gammaproteobacteria bacterium]